MGDLWALIVGAVEQDERQAFAVFTVVLRGLEAF